MQIQADFPMQSFSAKAGGSLCSHWGNWYLKQSAKDGQIDSGERSHSEEEGGRNKVGEVPREEC